MMNEHIVGIEHYGVTDGNAIGWCGATYNLIVGCTPAGPECDNCYAAGEAIHQLTMRRGGGRYTGLAALDGTTGTPRWTGKLWIAPREDWVRLLSGTRPEVVFVNSMGDPFHKEVPDGLLLHFFRLMHLARWKIFQVCTKRHHRMARFMARLYERNGTLQLATIPLLPEYQVEIPNVWMGVTAGTQKAADARLRELLKVKAAVRFVSMEPLLEAVDISAYIHGIDWVILGGESEPRGNYRPMDLAWARAVRDLCVGRRVPFFFKQRACSRATDAMKVLDNEMWRQLPRRELAGAPLADVRRSMREWARVAQVVSLDSAGDLPSHRDHLELTLAL